MKGSLSAYNRTSQIFHWVSALLIIGLAIFGTVMVRLDDGVSLKTLMYRSHTTIGSLILLITIARLVWLFRSKQPAKLPMPSWEQLAFTWNHRLLYILIIIMALSGTGMLLQSGVSLPPINLVPSDIQDVAARQGHSIFSKVFMALFVMHVAGVLYYQFTKGDTLGRMGVRWFSGSTPSAGD